MRNAVLALLALLTLFPAPSEAQSVVDTLRIRVWGTPASMQRLSGDTLAFPGDTLRFEVGVFGADGGRTVGSIEWAADGNLVEIVEATDSTLVVVPRVAPTCAAALRPCAIPILARLTPRRTSGGGG